MILPACRSFPVRLFSVLISLGLTPQAIAIANTSSFSFTVYRRKLSVAAVGFTTVGVASVGVSSEPAGFGGKSVAFVPVTVGTMAGASAFTGAVIEALGALTAGAFTAAGVDEIWCVSVNDAFVMGAWARDQKTHGTVRMLADGSAAFAQATGLTLDLTSKGMGLRSNRYSMLVKDGKVVTLNIEGPGKFEVSDAATLLAQAKG